MHTDNGIRRPQNFLILFFIGFFLVFVGIIILIVTAILYGEVSSNLGTIIFIGPIPIVVGAGPKAAWMVLLAIVIAVVSIVMFLIMRRKIDKEKA